MITSRKAILGEGDRESEGERERERTRKRERASERENEGLQLRDLRTRNLWIEAVRM